jgi:hypothetical protein
MDRAVVNRRPRKFLLGVAVLALLAFNGAQAAAAQAAPTWKVAGKDFSGSETTAVASGGPLSFSVPALGWGIKCEKVSATAGASIFGSREASATSLTLTGCGVEGTEKCRLKDSVHGVIGSLWFNAVKAKLVSAGVSTYEVYSPAAGEKEPFVTIVVENAPGKTCGLTGTFKFTGAMAAQVGTEQPTLTLTFNKAASVATGTEVKFGVDPVNTTGSIGQTLTGANSGKSWGAGPSEETGESGPSSPFWTIAGAAFSGSETTAVTSGGSMSFSIPELGITVRCEKVNSSTGGTISGLRQASDSSIGFTGCGIEGNEKCRVKDNVHGVIGSLWFLAVKAELVAQGTSIYEVYRPTAGEKEPFVTFLVENVAGKTCAFSGTYKFNGAMAAQVGAEQSNLTLTFNKAASVATGTEVKFGVDPVNTTGSIGQTLTGANGGKSWGVS